MMPLDPHYRHQSEEVIFDMEPLSAIWVGNPFFYPALADSGWRIHHLNPGPDQVFDWSGLLAAANFTPDLVVVADKSTPPMVTGMESFPCLTAFYAVDTHIHSWHPYYGQAFDACLVSLKDHIPLFTGTGLPACLDPVRVWWSPAYSHPLDSPCPPEPGTELWDCTFVGTVDAVATPERHAFLTELGRHVPGLHITRGGYRALFGRSRLVLNHAVNMDLNFRVFEALGCGACLVTPRVGHGLEELFRDGEELFLYDQNDMPGLVRLIEALLKNPGQRSHAAAKGYAAVNAKHRMRHRAEAFIRGVAALRGQDRGESRIAARLANAAAVHEAKLRFMYLLHAETAPFPAAKEAYLRAAARYKNRL